MAKPEDAGTKGKGQGKGRTAERGTGAPGQGKGKGQENGKGKGLDNPNAPDQVDGEVLDKPLSDEPLGETAEGDANTEGSA